MQVQVPNYLYMFNKSDPSCVPKLSPDHLLLWLAHLLHRRVNNMSLGYKNWSLRGAWPREIFNNEPIVTAKNLRPSLVTNLYFKTAASSIVLSKAGMGGGSMLTCLLKWQWKRCTWYRYLQINKPVNLITYPHSTWCWTRWMDIVTELIHESESTKVRLWVGVRNTSLRSAQKS